MSPAARVLVIDDNVDIHADFQKILTERPATSIDDLEIELFGEVIASTAKPQIACEVECASQGAAGLEMFNSVLDSRPFDLVFVDMRMPPGWDGLRTMKELWAVNPDQFIVLCTAYSDHSYHELQLQLGSRPNFLILRKPFHAEELQQIVFSVVGRDGERVREDKQKALELGRAVQEDELSLVFQPICELRTRQIKGFEALCRWIKDGKAVADPSEFVKLAEEHGRIHQLGKWVAREAVLTASKVLEFCPGADIPTITFNVSVLQLTREFPGELIELCAEFGVEHRNIGIEITETNIMSDVDQSREVLRELIEADFEVLMDDFGSGYSSLRSLFDLPYQIIKVDRGLSANIANDPASQVIVKAVIEMSRRLGKSFIAEGIETEEQLALLMKVGCNYGQGYLFSKPVSMDEAIALLSEPKSNQGAA